MKSLSPLTTSFIKDLEKEDPEKRRIIRIRDIYNKFQHAIEEVYSKEACKEVLSSINAVYIKIRTSESNKERRYKELIIYASDGLIRSDLDIRQEFIKMSLFRQGEVIEKYTIKASQFKMKYHHPFHEYLNNCDQIEKSTQLLFNNKKTSVSALTYKKLIENGNKIDNEKVRKSFLKAMKSKIEIKDFQ